ncbi:preprotein translocase subunit SecY [Ammoniphilus oxalaticus]|uniref:Protein translocase subunit SecY n=1 Tax=Ammoniphilus oxalaticus TaxID=66863 RepID=A0A419SFZ5_9BACL|nr:preprotein translocase subunit SecY [Ammoniphilus oxalaticus]RKD22685.1 preprotein translocase subunit SecY [Ammoniphilus oxalaticus]
MFSTISNIFKVGDLRRKVIFTLLMLVVFRIGAHVPVPNINISVLENLGDNNMFGIFNTFSGGALLRFSIFAMGIMPYITASIIMQLLSMDVVPKFTEWSKEGEAGRRKIAQITRYGTVGLGFIQALGLSIGFNNLVPGLVIKPSVTTYLFIALTLTAGTAFLMWLGEQITEYGVGNGISIIISAGIIAAIPDGLRAIYAAEFVDAGDALFLHIVKFLLILLVIVAIVVGVIFVQQGIRKIPVQYAKRVVGRRMSGGQSTHIPLKVNAAGVMPVIFAISLVVFPPTIAGFMPNNTVAQWISENFNYQAPIGMVFYVLLIIGFTFFYTFVQINPMQLADNMRNNGGYIPGIRPGKATVQFITRTLNRITFAGALFLAAVAIMPVIFTTLSNLPQQVQIGGTSLLIVIGVVLDTMKQIESQLIKRHYEGFIK